MPFKINIPAPTLPTLSALPEAIKKPDFILIVDSVHPVMTIDLITLCQNNPQYWHAESTIQKQHDTLIATKTSKLLETACISFADLAAYAVVTGPGSWIGSRVGITAIKAFHLIHSHPIIAVNSIEGQGTEYFENLCIAIKSKFSAKDFITSQALEPFYDKEYLVNGKEYKM
ncbi:MAG: hypothetical protein FWE01_00495 [Firmicutes bacterium]|nr:hypothetical protein [Bacillota bacterium]